MNINNRTASSILAQTIVVANEAAKSAAEAAASAASITDSPHFTGIPTAPTADPGTNSTQIATTAYLDRLLGAVSGIATLDSSGLVPVSQLPSLALTTIYTVNSQAAMLALPADIGDLAVRTDINQTFILAAIPPSTLGNWTLLLFSAPVTSVAGLIGVITATALTAALNTVVGDSGAGGTQGLVPAPAAGDAAAGKVLGAGGSYVVKADLASPAFTGTPTAPTAAVDTNTGQIASTAFVLAQASAVGDGTPAMDGTASRGASTHYARADHVHPTDTSRAALASPTFTGTPAAPTAAPGTNTTQIATTAFVQAAVGGGGVVTSVFGRSGTVVAASGDYTVAQVTGAAPLASPTLTGTPAAPTASPGTNTTQIATTAYADAIAALKANLANPSFTGSVTVGTPTGSGSLYYVDAALASAAGLVIRNAGVAAWYLYRPAGSVNFNLYGATAGLAMSVADATGIANFPIGLTAPTKSAGNNSTNVATTAYVDAADALKANIASPTLTGTPAAPTASPGTNTTQIATTAFVTAAVAAVSAAPVPTSDTLPVGWSGQLYCSVASVANGGTTAGSNLRIPQYDVTTPSAPTYVSGGTLQTGTWKNITGATSVIGYVMLWVRTA